MPLLAFAAAVDSYVGMCVGPGARGISFAGSGTVHMHDNHFGLRAQFEFDVPDAAGATW